MGNTRTFGDHVEAEVAVPYCRRLVQTAVVDPVDNGPRVGQRESASDTVGTSRPTGVHQPDPGLVALDLLTHQFGIPAWVQRQKRRSEAGREGGTGFGDPHFGPRHLGGVAADEMVHGLVRIQAADGRKYAEGVAGQEDDVSRMPDLARDHRVGNELDGIGRARVLRDGVVVVVDLTPVRIVDHVFQDRAVADGPVDLGLVLLGEADALGVAASLDVEDAPVAPDVLVVSHEPAARVGRKRGLAGSGEPEEEGDVVQFGGGVGRTVHRELPRHGHQIVHHGEDALFHLSGVLGSQDHHLPAFEAQVDTGLGGHFLGVEVGREVAGVVDHEVRFAELFQLLLRGPDHHVVHEQGVVGASADDPDLEAVTRIPTGVTVGDVQPLAGVEVVDGPLQVDQEVVLLERNVDGTPPDLVSRIRMNGDSLVARAASRLGARGDDQGPGIGDRRTPVVIQGLLVELSRCDVAQDSSNLDVVISQIDVVVQWRFHLNFSKFACCRFTVSPNPE